MTYKERARAFRASTERAAQYAPDEVALEEPMLFAVWSAGSVYAAGTKLRHGDGLYEVLQPVTAQAHQPPDAVGMLAVYRPIVLSVAGTLADPIPFVMGMDAENGKYYSYNGKTYLCKADMKPCVWAPGTAGMWQWELT